MGRPIGFKRHGSLSLAGDHERLEELHRGASMARVFGLEVRPVTPEEIGALYPLIDTQGVVGGVFLPGDGQLNPADVTHAMAQGARARGAKPLCGRWLPEPRQQERRRIGGRPRWAACASGAVGNVGDGQRARLAA